MIAATTVRVCIISICCLQMKRTSIITISGTTTHDTTKIIVKPRGCGIMVTDGDSEEISLIDFHLEHKEKEIDVKVRC